MEIIQALNTIRQMCIDNISNENLECNKCKFYNSRFKACVLADNPVNWPILDQETDKNKFNRNFHVDPYVSDLKCSLCANDRHWTFEGYSSPGVGEFIIYICNSCGTRAGLSRGDYLYKHKGNKEA